MIYRIYSNKDTFISNYGPNDVRKTGSNFGSCEILHTFRLAPVSGTAGGYFATASLGNILSKFDLSPIQSLTASLAAPSTGITYKLRMTDTVHDQTLPSSFDLLIQAVSQDWDEGNGHDVDNFSDSGVANWEKAKTTSYWTSAGASGSGPIVTAHFDTGHENIDANVTPIINAWLTGGLPNYGFLIKMSASSADYNDRYIKMFHGRNTFFPDKRPYVEAEWDDCVRDDRNNFLFDYTGSLVLYNRVRGQLANIPTIGTGSIYLRIDDASGSVKTITGSLVKTGIYSASFALPTGSYSGSIFRDVWFSGSRAFMTGTMHFLDSTSHENDSQSVYFVNVKNLKNQYSIDDKVIFNVFVRNQDYNPAVVLTASSGPDGLVIDRMFYKIMNDRTNLDVVSFGTGSGEEFTRLSYDQKGNYFSFYMNCLSAGNVYRLVFLCDVDGQNQIIDKQWKFRVV